MKHYNLFTNIFKCSFDTTSGNQFIQALLKFIIHDDNPNIIFCNSAQLSEEIAERRAEAEEMERIRLELHLEEQEEMARQQERDEMEKRIRHRIELQRTEMEQKRYKQMRKEMEQQEEEEFKKQVRARVGRVALQVLHTQ